MNITVQSMWKTTKLLTISFSAATVVVGVVSIAALYNVPNLKEEQLISAAKKGSTIMASVLVGMGADLNYKKSGALVSASEWGRVDIVRMLIDQGIDIHADNDAALRRAAIFGHSEIVEILLENGANVHVFDDEALTKAVKFGRSKETVEILLKYGADVRENLVQIAYGKGFTEIVEILCRYQTKEAKFTFCTLGM